MICVLIAKSGCDVRIPINDSTTSGPDVPFFHNFVCDLDDDSDWMYELMTSTSPW